MTDRGESVDPDAKIMDTLRQAAADGTITPPASLRERGDLVPDEKAPESVQVTLCTFTWNDGLGQHTCMKPVHLGGDHRCVCDETYWERPNG